MSNSNVRSRQSLWRSVMIPLAAFLLLTAGMVLVSPATSDAQSADNPTTNPGDWTQCATENGTCAFFGTKDVAYGAGSNWEFKTATNNIACNNTTFGDPIRGTRKACYYRDTTNPTPTDTPTDNPTAWTLCATENGTCNFSGTKDVAYGARSNWEFKTATNNIACNNTTFGDPIRGTRKACYYRGTTNSPTPPSTPTPQPTSTPDNPSTDNPTTNPGDWTSCATENGTCRFSGTKDVAYGARSNWAFETASNDIACNNATFGDPIPRTRKACYYRDTTNNPTPPSTPAPTPSGGDLVTNGTFEDGLNDWNQIEPAFESSDEYEGSKAAKVRDSGSVSQTLSLQRQTNYQVTAWVQGDASIGVNLAGNTISATGNDDDYELVEFTFNSGNATTAELFAKASSDTARIDNFAVYQTNGTTPGPTSTPAPEPTPRPDIPTTNESIALIESLFDLEGGPDDLDPVRGDTLVFDALTAQHVTPNGNGWRHEFKMAEENRRSMHSIDESFSATITPELSSGSKTIVAQYHGGGLGTLVKVYISDTNESNLSDSRGANGIFDLYARVRTSSSDSEVVVKFGTIRSGQSFDLELVNDRGEVTVSAMGITETLSVANSDGAYLKFGNYLQSQDPITMEKFPDSDDWEDFYPSRNLTTSVVTFSDVVYVTNN